MKKVEIESFVKSFLLFFISQTLLVTTLFFVEFKKEVQTLDENLFSSMRICSFDLKCDEFKIDFSPIDKHQLYTLYKTDNEIASYFSIPSSSKNALKIYLDKQNYLSKVSDIQKNLFIYYLLVLMAVVILSVLFSFYALSPLKNALFLTEEFIKDILHDFNTPLSTLRLNISMLKKQIGENTKITRMENSINTILNLQTNLKAYLNNHATQKECFELDTLIKEHISYLQTNSKNISINMDIKTIGIKTNKDGFARILENILSNAIKYNKQNGYIKITLEDKILKIEDSGKGIKDTKKVFDRFYKEQDRGIGIGLHIVKKLCDELGIGVRVDTQLEKGTSFYLDISQLTLC